MAEPSPLDASLLPALDAARRAARYLTWREVVDRVVPENIVLDPFSLLVGTEVRLGRGNVLHPAVVLGADEGGEVLIGDGNIFHAGCRLGAAGGRLVLGSGNQLGEGGLVVDADRPGEAIEIGDHGRYRYGAVIRGRASLGSGSQVLGPVIVEDCTLEAGGSFAEPDPDRRGGVLKGVGPARGLRVPRGQVIAAYGPFAQAMMQPQRDFHPKP